jgi:OmpA family.
MSISLIVLLFSMSATKANAQAENNYNKEVRTNTWSIYAQGGVSWATGVWYPNIDAKQSYKLSPAVGGGIDYNIRPWVRIGVEYIYSRYRREQRISMFDTKVVPIKAYGNYMMNYHNAKLNAGFNFMEIWSNRKAQWFNIYLGTGVGYMMARGNEYGMYFSTTQTQNGTTTPVGGSISIDNSSSITFTDNVKTTNQHSSFDKFYIPTVLSIEADLCRQLTVGVKGEADFLLNRGDIAPKNLIFALATVRFNIGAGKRAPVVKDYSSEVESLTNRVNALLKEAEQENARAHKAEKENKKLNEENANLKNRLNDCEESKAKMADKETYVVPFDNGSAVVSKAEREKLSLFAQSVRGKQLSIMAEASTPGTKDGNQRLSERRLESVIKILLEEGLKKENLKPRLAIGAQNGISTPDGRKVTITVE